MAAVSELQIKVGIKRIKTPVDVRDEMERVYRAMARKQIESADGARMINALHMLLHTMERASYQDVTEAAEEMFEKRG